MTSHGEPLRLPPELIVEVCRGLSNRDLLNLCLVSKAYEAVFRPILYENVRLRVPQQRLPNNSSYGLVLLNDGLSYTRNLKIINSWSEKKFIESKESDEEEQNFEGAEGSQMELYDRYGRVSNALRYQDLSTALNKLVQAQIVRIPPRQLHSFSWLHRFPLKGETLNLVLQRQQGLKVLQFFEPNFNKYTVKAPGLGLQKFSCRSIGSGDVIGSVTSIIQASSRTLRSLTLGQERLWLDSALSTNLLPDLPNIFKDIESNFWQLERLELVCLDLNFGSTPTLIERIDFFYLTSLSLLSCPRSVKLLTALTTKFAASDTDSVVKLKEFRFRIERPPHRFTTAMEGFLQSFSGLKVLSVLVDGIEPNRMPKVDCFLSRHSSSLQILVWEGRKHRRESQDDYDYTCSMGTYLERASPFCKILESCKNLVELSIPYDWSKVRPDDSDDEDTDDPAISLSTSLRTFHIRNSPLEDSPMAIETALSHTTRAIAQEFLEDTLSDIPQSNLELLIIGPLTFLHHREWQYKPSRRSCFPHYRFFPAWNRLMLFTVEKFQTRFKKPIAVAVQQEFESVHQLKHTLGFHVESLKSTML